MSFPVFLRFIIVLLFLSSLQLRSETVEVSLKGFLGKGEIETAEKIVLKAAAANTKTMLIEVNSATGDLEQVLKLAKSLYALRASKNTEIIVFIQDSAIGPAAIIPFLADKLYISYFVSWGDIPLGSTDSLPTNILRNTVKSLIQPKNPHYEILSLMAVAMSDPSVQVIDDNGWKLSKEEGKPLISREGETLVVNHNQLRSLGIVSGMMSYEEFRKQYIQEGLENDVKAEPPVQENDKTVLHRLSKYVKYDEQGPNTVGLIKIDDKNSQISQATWIYVKSALEYYKGKKPTFVILELNTPGGEVFSAQKISDALKDLDTQYDIPIVCFINNWAISAGAMLAYSCRFIAVTKDASMGAAEPVQAGEGGQLVSASEKVNSALRADFANRAAFFDRNPDIAEAMVDKDIILVARYGKIVRLDNEDQIRRTGPNPDVIISAKGKLLTLDTEEMMRYGVADLLLLPAKLEFITETERDKGKWPASKMLLFQNTFFKQIPEAVVDYYQMDWKTYFLTLITNPIVSSLLFLGMLLGFYIEINSPGFGLPGSFALLCLFLIILSSFALEVANMLEVILLLIGVLFIALDLFFIPTFGLLGIVGVIFFLIGLFGMMLPGIEAVDYEFDSRTFNAAGQEFIRRLAWLCGTLVAGIVIVLLLGRYIMPNFSGFKRFVLAGSEQTKENGYISGEDPKNLPPVGSRGEVLATLRPSGKVVIDNRIFDAITNGSFIEKGEVIVVESLDGSMIVVVKAQEGVK